MKRGLYQSLRGTAALPASKQRGSALVSVTVFSALILLITVASMTSISNQTRNTGRSLAYKQSLALAEAGAEMAMASLNATNNKWSGWSSSGGDRVLSNQELRDSDNRVVGTYTVRVINPDSSTPIVDSVGVSQVGASFPVSRRIRVPVEGNTTPSPFGSYGIYSSSDIIVNSNASTDGYDSSKGQHGPGNQYMSHSMAAVGNVLLNSKANVGNIQAGGRVTRNANVSAGEVLQNNMPTAPPPFPDAELAAAKANNDNHQIVISEYKNNEGEVNPRTAIVPNNGKFNFNSLNINGRMRIRFPAGTYYLDSIQVNSNADIVADGPVKLFMDPGNNQSAIMMNSNTTINAVGTNPTPSNFQVFIKSGRVTFNSNYTMYAGLFAPNSDVAIFNSNTKFYGAVVAGRITMNSNSHIYLDHSLTAPAGSSGFLPRMWVEVPTSM